MSVGRPRPACGRRDRGPHPSRGCSATASVQRFGCVGEDSPTGWGPRGVSARGRSSRRRARRSVPGDPHTADSHARPARSDMSRSATRTRSGRPWPIGERFPDQLVPPSIGPVPTLELVANLGVNGYTTADLIRDELPALAGLEPGFVDAPDRRQRRRAGRLGRRAYDANVVTILDGAPGPAARRPDRHRSRSRTTRSRRPAPTMATRPRSVRRSSRTTRRWRAGRRSAPSGSSTSSTSPREALEDRTLVASDGLHPSGAQYARWVERIRPVVERLLEH